MDSNIDFKYTIYKTTNKVNDKVYIGCHKTTVPNDDYIGSGKILKRAIKKYGRENFEKEVLFIFDTPEEMFSKESDIVDKLFVESDHTYNLLIGGWGGYDYVNSTGKNLYGKNGDVLHGGRNLRDGKEMKQFLIDRGLWESWKMKLSDIARERYRKFGSHWSGRKHKESTKRKIGERMSVTQKGNRNSQFGTCWIYSNTEKKCIRIEKKDLSSIKDGWKKGRKMKFISVNVTSKDSNKEQLDNFKQELDGLGVTFKGHGGQWNHKTGYGYNPETTFLLEYICYTDNQLEIVTNVMKNYPLLNADIIRYE
jgi:hypothetical protein